MSDKNVYENLKESFNNVKILLNEEGIIKEEAGMKEEIKMIGENLKETHPKEGKKKEEKK